KSYPPPDRYVKASIWGSAAQLARTNWARSGLIGRIARATWYRTSEVPTRKSQENRSWVNSTAKKRLLQEAARESAAPPRFGALAKEPRSLSRTSRVKAASARPRLHATSAAMSLSSTPT